MEALQGGCNRRRRMGVDPWSDITLENGSQHGKRELAVCLKRQNWLGKWVAYWQPSSLQSARNQLLIRYCLLAGPSQIGDTGRRHRSRPSLLRTGTAVPPAVSSEVLPGVSV